jgi:hypothetical protein
MVLFYWVFRKILLNGKIAILMHTKMEMGNEIIADFMALANSNLLSMEWKKILQNIYLYYYSCVKRILNVLWEKWRKFHENFKKISNNNEE